MKMRVIRVNPHLQWDPVGPFVPAYDNPNCIDESIACVHRAMDGWSDRSHKAVINELAALIGGMRGMHKYPPEALRGVAEIYVWSALRHPDSPFGLGYSLRKRGRIRTVIYHGEFFDRDKRGVLTKISDERAEDWPTRAEWMERQEQVRRFALSRGWSV